MVGSVDALFSRALELSGEERDEFIRRQCGDDEQRRRILALIEASQAADDDLENRLAMARDRLWRAALDDGEHEGEDLSGQRIGAWRLVRRIARGGLATVYRATRDDGAFDQTVAFKVLRRGLDTDDLVARFRAERQFLSALDHPTIVQILDGGSLEDGRPYLVLEYVDGMPISAYCETHRVTIRGRVALVIEVLRALHHAHRHLVVHRDVKPSNVLVTAEGNVALLDFGIAKLLDDGVLPGASTLTRTGMSLHTPSYGSPEQIAGEPVTTASDIYQVGLVLYELLAGKRAFDSPRRPADATVPQASRLLLGKPEYRAVSGDLDAIVGKAMHLDPNRRYASADEMLSDLQRYLDGLPVLARPDKPFYRLSKLILRNPWLAPVAATAVLATIAYVATLAVHSQRIEREQQLAQAAQQFLVELFRSPDPFAPADEARGRDITVVEALDLGQQRVRDELRDQPELRAAILASVSDVYGSLDQRQDAIALREEALALERRLYGDRSDQVMISLQRLGTWHAANGDLTRADGLLDEQLAIARALHSGNAPALGEAEIAAGIHASRKGDLGESSRLLRLGVEKLRTAPDSHARTLIDALITLADQHGLEDLEETLAFTEEARQIADRVFGPESMQAALTRVRLATTLSALGEYQASERSFLEVIPVLEARLGANHGGTLGALNNLGFLYSRFDSARSEQVHREVLERRLAVSGDEPSRLLAESHQNLAAAITLQGRYDESIPMHWKAHEMFRTVLNDDNYLTAFPLLTIAYAELQRGRPAAAEAAARAALDHMRATVPGTMFEGVAQCFVGLSLERQGRLEEGGAMVQDSHGKLTTSGVSERYLELCRLPRD